MALSTLHRRAFRAVGLSAPSWAKPWQTRQTATAGRQGPKIAVLGNCQARAIAQAMRLLAPASAVDLVPFGRLKRDHGHIDTLARALGAYDHVFAQQFTADLIPGGDIHALRAARPGIVLFPTIVFTAFHPDTLYVLGRPERGRPHFAPSPMGLYHSALALAAHRLGLTLPQAITLFREEVFAPLGYLDVWDAASRELLTSAAEIGFPLNREILRWARAGSFMHIINHPKAMVVEDIARRLLAESGLAPEPVAVADYLGDELIRDVVWPVYPEVAETFGFTGSYLFKNKPVGGAFPALFDLESFLRASFAIYDAQPGDALHCARVDAWLATPEIRALLEAARA
ncbi:WcbI family polysaccharide biosynthesis putative acetyltransferase [Methylobacterium sp. BE186]|uniref:WcbI family polysaccharide biosynthesis putative acetyltransferase n=1 Tax=Methylobacterium sp. BE186 TaxID=2817715 RepID=UPI00286A1F1A|nr:WcbI family polysaccharide biosynthesis putative acetyltransferase [Methylobacterium sp. BE186]